MGASLRNEAELLGHEPGRPDVAPGGMRELTIEEKILVHGKPGQYASIAEQVELAMEFDYSRRRCMGAWERDESGALVISDERQDCDEGCRCGRHARVTEIVDRYLRLRYRARDRLAALIRINIEAKPFSSDELESYAEIQAYRESFIEWVWASVIANEYPWMRWSRQRAA